MASSSSEMASSAASDIESDPTLFDIIRFSVGSDKVVIEARKGLLAASSPVFKAMLFGSMAEKSDSINLEGDCPQAFRALVDFVQYKELTVEDFEVALAVCLMAHRYIMPNLVDKCHEYMGENFDYLYGLDYYECLKLIGGRESNKKMTEVMVSCQCHAQDLFDSERHLNVRIDTLIELFKSDHLNITSEMVLIDALAKYKEVNDDPSLNEGILKALSHVRLFTLKPVDLVVCQKILKKILCIHDVQKVVARLLIPPMEGNMYNLFSKSIHSRNIFYLALTRSMIKQNNSYKLKSRTFYTSKINFHPKPYCVRGVILGIPGDEVIPELDVVLSMSTTDGNQVKQGKFLIKNLDKAGRQCIFKNKYEPANSNILTMIILNDVSISGAYTGQFVRNNYRITAEISNTPVDALLKGLLIN